MTHEERADLDDFLPYYVFVTHNECHRLVGDWAIAGRVLSHIKSEYIPAKLPVVVTKNPNRHSLVLPKFYQGHFQITTTGSSTWELRQICNRPTIVVALSGKSISHLMVFFIRTHQRGWIRTSAKHRIIQSWILRQATLEALKAL